MEMSGKALAVTPRQVEQIWLPSTFAPRCHWWTDEKDIPSWRIPCTHRLAQQHPWLFFSIHSGFFVKNKYGMKKKKRERRSQEQLDATFLSLVQGRAALEDVRETLSQQSGCFPPLSKCVIRHLNPWAQAGAYIQVLLTLYKSSVGRVFSTVTGI